MPPCPERDNLLRKAHQAETALRLDEWINSPGLQPPKQGCLSKFQLVMSSATASLLRRMGE